MSRYLNTCKIKTTAQFASFNVHIQTFGNTCMSEKRFIYNYDNNLHIHAYTSNYSIRQQEIKYCWKLIFCPLLRKYLVNIAPVHLNSWPEVRGKIRSSNFEFNLKSLGWSLWSHIWWLFAPMYMKSWPEVKLFKVGIGSNFAQYNHLISRKSYLLIICRTSHGIDRK